MIIIPRVTTVHYDGLNSLNIIYKNKFDMTN